MGKFRLVIITGMSGAGKTQVIRMMEDIEYFCVDNLPSTLITKFAELCIQSAGRVTKIALVVDIRDEDLFDSFVKVLKEMDYQGYIYELLFLEASDQTIIRRFKETRRRHPMSLYGRLSEGIILERERLEQIRERATNIIDTSDLSSRMLREKIIQLYSGEKIFERIMITVVSFGFKYGVPLDADMVFDVRFLPNPFYVETLKYKDGTAIEIAEYILKWPITIKFMEKMNEFIDFLIPNYANEGKSQLIIAVGCTGGFHRSVFVAERIYERLKTNGYNIYVEHRDIKRNIIENEGMRLI